MPWERLKVGTQAGSSPAFGTGDRQSAHARRVSRRSRTPIPRPGVVYVGILGTAGAAVALCMPENLRPINRLWHLLQVRQALRTLHNHAASSSSRGAIISSQPTLRGPNTVWSQPLYVTMSQQLCDRAGFGRSGMVPCGGGPSLQAKRDHNIGRTGAPAPARLSSSSYRCI